MGKVLPIGLDNFRDLRTREKENYYVDKTLMIKDFLDYGNVVSLITRPRRFGKTLNVTMLRDFFDIEQDSLSIFDGLNIMKTAYANQINQRPVIFLTFENCCGKTVEMMKNSLAHVVKDEYFRYEAIFAGHVDFESTAYHEFYSIFTTLKKISEIEEDKEGMWQVSRMPDEMLKRSLVVLTQAVANFYDKKSLLLIDDYDQPLIKAHEMGYGESFSKEMYGSFLGNALKGNDYLEQALLTGVQRVAKESIFSEINNFIVYTVLDHQYASYFGFDTDETQELLEHYDLELNEEVTSYYGGYLFAGVDIYNPWSILNYVNKKKLQSYWMNTLTTELIRESVPVADAFFHRSFEKLIANGRVAVRMSLDASFIELSKTETLWGLFVNAGYLTVTHADYHLKRFMVRIPNEEIKREFELIVSEYTKLSNEMLQEMYLALIDGYMNEFLSLYRDLVLESTSFHGSRENAKLHSSYEALHMLFFGMVMNLRELYDITSNIEFGDDRNGIVMRSKDASRIHIIIEFKQGADVERLKYEALKQIHENAYYTGLRGKILCVGIAYGEKICQLISEVMER